MNDHDQSIWERSSLVRFSRWLLGWRIIRRILIVMAWTATLIALVYGEENWRGRRAWNKYRKELEARGEQLDLKAFIPKPVPNEQNFAATPFFEFLFLHKTNRYDWEDSYSQAGTKIPYAKSNYRGHRRLTDLVAWKTAFAAIGADELKRHPKVESGPLDLQSRAKSGPAVLAGLKTNEAVFAELRAASQRPFSRYPVIYNLEDPWGILIPHLADIKGVCQRLQLKACAELAVGQSDNALDDVKLMLYLADSVKEETILISYLVRISCLQIAVQPIWEGLAEHRWSDAQLRELQTRLQQYDFLADLKRPLDSERAAGILTVDLLYRQKYRLSTLGESPGTSSSGETFADLMARIAPRGWYYQEQLNYCRLYEGQLVGTFDATRKRVSPTRIESNDNELERTIGGGRLGRELNAILRHHIVAALLLPVLTKLPLKAAIAQTVADQAALACALERYRLANGQFPEKLEGLTPRFISPLPNDVLTGEPYKYRRTDDGRFVLYSIGWDEKDDGGAPGKTLFDEKQGDWVWQYPSQASYE